MASSIRSSGVRSGRMAFNVQRLAFGVRRSTFGVWREWAVTLSWHSYFAVRFCALNQTTELNRRLKIASTRAPNAKRQTPNALPMEIGRDQNEESSYEVKEGPGDREADEQAEGRLEPLRGNVSGPDRGGP